VSYDLYLSIIVFRPSGNEKDRVWECTIGRNLEIMIKVIREIL